MDSGRDGRPPTRRCGDGRVRGQHGQPGRQSLRYRPLDHEGGEPGVRPHEGQPLGRVAGVQRYVRGSGGRRTQQGGQFGNRAGYLDTDEVTGADALGGQPVGESLHSRVQFTVGEFRAVGRHHGHRVGCRGGPLREHPDHRGVRRAGRGCPVVRVQRPLQLVARQQRQVGEADAGVGEHRVQEGAEVADDPGGRTGCEASARYWNETSSRSGAETSWRWARLRTAPGSRSSPPRRPGPEAPPSRCGGGS